ncbi:MAG: HAD hydrolase family protein [Chloroflexi bacterium]|nr:HAD hydrolase family protein [Chloroflexota bacterium]
MRRDLLGDTAGRWAALGAGLPASSLRLVLADIDGVITRGEGQAIDIDVLQRLAAINATAQLNPRVPAITLCTGRQAPYVELMAQLVGAFLPCIFEHGAGLFFPTTFLYEFDARLGSDYAGRLARLRAAIDEPLIRTGRAFVQPGKEATMTLYPRGPVGESSVDGLLDEVAAIVAHAAPDYDVARNVHGVEVRPRGIDKGSGARRMADLLEIPLTAIAGIGDSDPDLAFLDRVGLSAAPANATPAVRGNVNYVATVPFGAGLLEIVTLVEQRNRDSI